MPGGESTETRLALLESRLDQVWEWINGGPSTLYKDSARGKLHDMAETQATADKLAEAAREVRRLQGEQRKSRLSGWQWTYLAVCATAAAAAPYVVLLAH